MSGLAIGSRDRLQGQTYTIGVGGNYSNLPDALNGTRSLTTTLVASFTGSGTLDTHVITRASGDSIAAYIGQLVGVRIDNATLAAPIVLGWVETATQIRLPYVLPATYTSKIIDVYLITPVNLTLLPGHRELIAADLAIDASFITFSALVPRTASVEISSSQYNLIFGANDNHLHFRGLRFIGDLEEALIAGAIFQGPGSSNPLIYLGDMSFYDCECYGGHVDFMAATANFASPSLKFKNCYLMGFYDILNLAMQRDFQMKDSTLLALSTGGFDGAARAITFALTGTSPAYSDQHYTIENNLIVAKNSFAGAVTACVHFADPLDSSAVVKVKSNTLRAAVTTGNLSAYGLYVSSTGTNTPTIQFEDNTCAITKSGTGVAYFAKSDNANYVIRERNNRAINGNVPTWGTNVVEAEYQTVAYAAAITPDLVLGDNITIGTLTGNLTVNAPLNPIKGAELFLNYTADATPGRTITYDAVFKSSAVPASTASAKASHHFVYDGTNWVQTGGALLWL